MGAGVKENLVSGSYRTAGGCSPLHGRPGLVVDVQHDGLRVAGQVAACTGTEGEVTGSPSVTPTPDRASRSSSGALITSYSVAL